MNVNLRQAVEEAGPFLALLEESQDELDVTLLHGWGYPPLTLGTIRALYALASDVDAIVAEHGPALNRARGR